MVKDNKVILYVIIAIVFIFFVPNVLANLFENKSDLGNATNNNQQQQEERMPNDLINLLNNAIYVTGIERVAGEKVSILNNLVKYVDIEVGDGREVEEGLRISLDYVGGTVIQNRVAVFDVSPKDFPLEFGLGVDPLIPGFVEGIKGMKEGGIRVIEIQPEAGYGNQNIPGIPANSVITFIVKINRVSDGT